MFRTVLLYETQEIERCLWLLQFVPVENKGQKMCKRAIERTVEKIVESNLWLLKSVCDKYKT